MVVDGQLSHLQNTTEGQSLKPNYPWLIHQDIPSILTSEAEMITSGQDTMFKAIRNPSEYHTHVCMQQDMDDIQTLPAECKITFTKQQSEEG